MASNDKKRQAISATLKATCEKRKQQRCRVFELKVSAAKMSRCQRDHLHRLFLEAKWFYNWLVSLDDAFVADTRVKSVPVKCGEQFEEREIRCLSSQMKQGLATLVQTAIRGLATKKKKGFKTGRLKFKRSIRAVPLKQHGTTYSFTNGGNRLKIQKLKGSLRVRGVDQLPAGADLANAVLLKKASGYYLKVTVYTDKNGEIVPPTRSVGIDAGLKDQLAFSNGVVVRYRTVEEQWDRIKRLYRDFCRKKKGSKNRYRALVLLQKEFEHLTDCKRDTVNKLVSFLAREYRIVCYQDENLRAWQRLWGKKMLDTSLGRLLSAVEERAVLPSKVERFFPSTQLCSNPECDYRYKKALAERVHACPACGLVLERDINADSNNEQEGIALLIRDGKLVASFQCWQPPGTERTSPRGDRSSTPAQRMVAYYNTIPRVSARLVNEARSPLRSFPVESESEG